MGRRAQFDEKSHSGHKLLTAHFVKKIIRGVRTAINRSSTESYSGHKASAVRSLFCRFVRITENLISLVRECHPPKTTRRIHAGEPPLAKDDRPNRILELRASK